MLTGLFNLIVYPGIIFIIILSILFNGILRKLAARVQSRIGPPIIQPFWDIIKLIQKEDIKQEGAGTGFDLWPVAGFASVLVSGLLIPYLGIIPLKGLDNIILFIYFFSLGSLVIFISGFSSSNPFASVGSTRGLVQMIGYEFPLLMALLILAVNAESLLVSDITTGLSGGFGMAIFPFAFLAFIVALLASSEVPPFHIPNAHQEIVTGPLTEYTGTRLAFLELTYMLKLFVLISLGVVLFLGGASNIIMFLIKALILLFVATILRAGLARMRIDQGFKLCWIVGLLAIIDLIRVIIL